MADSQLAPSDTVINGTNGEIHHQDVAKEYSLLPKLLPHLDRHLVFPLLNFQEEQTPEDEDISEITQLKYNLLKQTNMSDFVGKFCPDSISSKTTTNP